jgi:hypothetical protein
MYRQRRDDIAWHRAICQAVGLALVALSAPTLAAQVIDPAARPSLELGALDSPAHQVFGRIADVSFDWSGGLFVLDGQARELRWFGADGELLARAGRSGQGPGEFLSPVAVAIGREGEVAVLDAQQARVSWFTAREGALIPSGDSRVVVGAFDFCVVGSAVLVLAHSPEGDGIVFVTNRDGVVERSFGTRPPMNPRATSGLPQRIVESLSVRGRIACDPGAERFVLIHEQLPIVRAFSLSGEVLWETELQDYHPVHWVTNGGIRMSPDPASGTAHTTLEATLTDDGLVVVTLHEGGGTEPAGRLERRVLRADNGEEIERAPSAGTVRHARLGRIVMDVQLPWPRLLVYDRD